VRRVHQAHAHDVILAMALNTFDSLGLTCRRLRPARGIRRPCLRRKTLATIACGKLQLKQGIGYAKPGIPADGEILVSGDRWPKHKRAQ